MVNNEALQWSPQEEDTVWALLEPINEFSDKQKNELRKNYPPEKGWRVNNDIYLSVKANRQNISRLRKRLEEKGLVETTPTKYKDLTKKNREAKIFRIKRDLETFLLLQAHFTSKGEGKKFVLTEYFQTNPHRCFSPYIDYREFFQTIFGKRRAERNGIKPKQRKDVCITGDNATDKKLCKAFEKYNEHEEELQDLIERNTSLERIEKKFKRFEKTTDALKQAIKKIPRLPIHANRALLLHKVLRQRMELTSIQVIEPFRSRIIAEKQNRLDEKMLETFTAPFPGEPLELSNKKGGKGPTRNTEK